jgi:hypothetical protein
MRSEVVLASPSSNLEKVIATNMPEKLTDNLPSIA